MSRPPFPPFPAKRDAETPPDAPKLKFEAARGSLLRGAESAIDKIEELLSIGVSSREMISTIAGIFRSHPRIAGLACWVRVRLRCGEG